MTNLNEPKISFNKPKKVLALVNKDTVELKNSSSGGAFMVLANAVIKQGGKVFGCVLENDGSCYHKMADNLEDLKAMQGSKYVRSNVKNTYAECLEALKKDYKVLYSGTPCQIYQLNQYLHNHGLEDKYFENLITVDLFCLGTPSQKLFKLYIQWLNDKVKSDNGIYDYKFRDKIISWDVSTWSYKYKRNNKEHKKWGYSWESPYYNAYAHGKINLKQCNKCEFKKQERCSDFSIGDFSGIGKHHLDFLKKYRVNGISAILINTNKGLEYFNEYCSDSVYVHNSKYEYAKQASISCKQEFDINDNFSNAISKAIKDEDYNYIFDKLLKVDIKFSKKITTYLRKIKRRLKKCVA